MVFPSDDFYSVLDNLDPSVEELWSDDYPQHQNIVFSVANTIDSTISEYTKHVRKFSSLLIENLESTSTGSVTKDEFDNVFRSSSEPFDEDSDIISVLSKYSPSDQVNPVSFESISVHTPSRASTSDIRFSCKFEDSDTACSSPQTCVLHSFQSTTNSDNKKISSISHSLASSFEDLKAVHSSSSENEHLNEDSEFMWNIIADPSGASFFYPSVYMTSSSILTSSLRTRSLYDRRYSNVYANSSSLGMRRGVVFLIDTSIDPILSEIMKSSVSIYILNILYRSIMNVFESLGDNDWLGIVSGDEVWQGGIMMVDSDFNCSNPNGDLEDIDDTDRLKYGLMQLRDETIRSVVRNELSTYFESLFTYVNDSISSTAVFSTNLTVSGNSPFVSISAASSTYDAENNHPLFGSTTAGLTALSSAINPTVSLKTVLKERLRSDLGWSSSQQNMSSFRPLPHSSPLHMFVFSLGSCIHFYYPQFLLKERRRLLSEYSNFYTHFYIIDVLYHINNGTISQLVKDEMLLTSEYSDNADNDIDLSFKGHYPCLLDSVLDNLEELCDASMTRISLLRGVDIIANIVRKNDISLFKLHTKSALQETVFQHLDSWLGCKILTPLVTEMSEIPSSILLNYLLEEYIDDNNEKEEAESDRNAVDLLQKYAFIDISTELDPIVNKVVVTFSIPLLSRSGTFYGVYSSSFDSNYLNELIYSDSAYYALSDTVTVDFNPSQSYLMLFDPNKKTLFHPSLLPTRIDANTMDIDDLENLIATISDDSDPIYLKSVNSSTGSEISFKEEIIDACFDEDIVNGSVMAKSFHRLHESIALPSLLTVQYEWTVLSCGLQLVLGVSELDMYRVNRSGPTVACDTSMPSVYDSDYTLADENNPLTSPYEPCFQPTVFSHVSHLSQEELSALGWEYIPEDSSEYPSLGGLYVLFGNEVFGIPSVLQENGLYGEDAISFDVAKDINRYLIKQPCDREYFSDQELDDILIMSMLTYYWEYSLIHGESQTTFGQFLFDILMFTRAGVSLLSPESPFDFSFHFEQRFWVNFSYANADMPLFLFAPFRIQPTNVFLISASIPIVIPTSSGKNVPFAVASYTLSMTSLSNFFSNTICGESYASCILVASNGDFIFSSNSYHSNEIFSTNVTNSLANIREIAPDLYYFLLKNEIFYEYEVFIPSTGEYDVLSIINISGFTQTATVVQDSSDSSSSSTTRTISYHVGSFEDECSDGSFSTVVYSFNSEYDYMLCVIIDLPDVPICSLEDEEASEFDICEESMASITSSAHWKIANITELSARSDNETDGKFYFGKHDVQGFRVTVIVFCTLLAVVIFWELFHH
ncbi:hypothetical protein ADUPG1_012232 [Aduncisulcus paluster]|uniref:Uncharacterized protein n=1 Tax=Aduncisulcus paluster TaxID=2918883 RepID=A0ABQ5K0L4_9EUKA|nr:hypothetical protein ADUPG1_012232 [Aduncisulcus paluster]